jgi:hypothetical protein
MNSITDPHGSLDFEDGANNSREISKEKFSLDMSAIENASKMQPSNQRGRPTDVSAIKEMSHFGGSLQSQSIYSTEQPADRQ